MMTTFIEPKSTFMEENNAITKKIIQIISEYENVSIPLNLDEKIKEWSQPCLFEKVKSHN